jgi:chemotaxis protein MotB
MADDENKEEQEEQSSEACEECVAGLPLWMGTFSDLVTLLLTFFVLLLSFAKTETSKYKAALGSIREAFGGNTLKFGDVVVPGKSPDDSPTMIDSQSPVKPFPIEFLTSEGLLDKHEINRASDETLKEFQATLKRYNLQDNADVYEINEGVKVHLKDRIYFAEGKVEILKANKSALSKVIEMLRDSSWTVYVQGYSAKSEKSNQDDSYSLSSRRSTVISKYLIKEGIRAEKITSISYGDSRPLTIEGMSEQANRELNRRVEFIFKKQDILQKGRKVSSE